MQRYERCRPPPFLPVSGFTYPPTTHPPTRVTAERHLDGWLRQRITGFEMEAFMKMVAERQGASPTAPRRKQSLYLSNRPLGSTNPCVCCARLSNPAKRSTRRDRGIDGPLVKTRLHQKGGGVVLYRKEIVQQEKGETAQTGSEERKILKYKDPNKGAVFQTLPPWKYTKCCRILTPCTQLLYACFIC